MKKKLYLISFTLEGFDQYGSDDPNDDNGPVDIEVEKEDETEPTDPDKDLLEHEEAAIDELDLANKTNASTSASRQHVTSSISASDFHPHNYLKLAKIMV